MKIVAVWREPSGSVDLGAQPDGLRRTAKNGNLFPRRSLVNQLRPGSLHRPLPAQTPVSLPNCGGDAAATLRGRWVMVEDLDTGPEGLVQGTVAVLAARVINSSGVLAGTARLAHNPRIDCQ